MNNYEFLEKTRTIATKIKVREEELARLESRIGVQSINYDKEATSGSGDTERVSHAIMNYIELKEEILNEIYNLESSKKIARKIIDSLGTPEQIEVMSLRFIQAYTVKDISKKMGYSEDWVYRTIRKSRNILKVAKNY